MKKNEQNLTLKAEVERLKNQTEIRVGVITGLREKVENEYLGRIKAENKVLELIEENNRLRFLLTSIAPDCLHCGLSDIAKCASGFPGCGQMDDLNYATPELEEIVKKWREAIENKPREILREVESEIFEGKDKSNAVRTINFVDIMQIFAKHGIALENSDKNSEGE